MGKTDKTDKMRVSYSAYATYSLCGEMYRRQYIEKETTGQTLPMIKGLSVHKVAEKNYGQKISTWKDMKRSDLIMYGVEMLRAYKKTGGVILSKDEEKVGKAKIYNQAEQEVIGNTDIYSSSVAPRVQPVAVEQYYKIPLAETLELSCVIDTITIDKTIRDIKCSSGRGLSPKSMQLIIYAEVYRRKFGMFPNQVIIDKISSKDGRYTYNELIGQVELEDVNRVIRRLNMMIKGIKSGVFMPASQRDWICNPKWCTFFYRCKYAITEG